MGDCYHGYRDVGRATYLAYVLQYSDDVAEIAHMENRELKVDISIVTNAVSQGLSACVTGRVLLACALEGGREGGRKRKGETKGRVTHTIL